MTDPFDAHDATDPASDRGGALLMISRREDEVTTEPALERGGTLLMTTRREDVDISDPATEGVCECSEGDLTSVKLTASGISDIAILRRK